MSGAIGRRATYRVRQFVTAIRAGASPISEVQAGEARSWLPEGAWSLFQAMPRQDQRHSLEVLHTLQDAGEVSPELAQAALLHDCAKHRGGIRLWHRVAVVLVRAFYPARMDRLRDVDAPAVGSCLYPFWAQVHHPESGASLASEAGCDPLAVTLIRHHGGGTAAGMLSPETERLLAQLQEADDDN
jgi:hypothetical protein